MNRAVIRGPEAKVMWSYHTAASLGPWTLTAEGAGGTVTAKVVTHDACAVSQQPLMFVVPRPKGHKWVWTVQTLQISGDQLTLTVNMAPEEN
jgi:hypothetical protein